MSMRSYKELVVWQRSMEAVTEIYRLAHKLPKEEIYALSDQMRRAAVSIPSNIAEGHSRNSTKEYVQFLFIARGSRAEVETQLQICVNLNYLHATDIESAMHLLDEISRMLSALIKKLTPTP